jgi:uncharacterized protein YaaQ
MKLILAIVRDSDDATVTGALVNNGFRVTRMASTGGFLRRGKVTLMIGVEDDKLEAAVNVLRVTCCTPPEEDQHHATMFVLNAAHFEQV